MFQKLCATILLTSLLLPGCATVKTRFPQCSRSSFYDCLGMTAQQCDASFIQAKKNCEQKQADNSVFENMPDGMKEDHLTHCLVDDVIERSGLPDDETRQCLRW